MSGREIEIVEGLSSRTEIDDAAVVGARAFQNDPFLRHLAPPSMLRARGLAIYMRAMLKNLGAGGRILTARHEGRIVGLGAWVGPGGYPAPGRNQAAQVAGLVHAFAPRPQMAPDGMRYMRAIEHEHPKDPLWYLAILTVDPELQRSGIGRRLVEPILERCDVEGIDAYLETQKHDNLAYYQRFGFETVSELRPVASGPPLWTMRRSTRG